MIIKSETNCVSHTSGTHSRLLGVGGDGGDIFNYYILLSTVYLGWYHDDDDDDEQFQQYSTNDKQAEKCHGRHINNKMIFSYGLHISSDVCIVCGVEVVVVGVWISVNF